VRRSFLKESEPKNGILLIRFEDEGILSLNFCSISDLFFSCPVSKGGEWSEKPKKKGRNTDTKTPNKMLRPPALHSDVINKIILWIVFCSIVFTAKES